MDISYYKKYEPIFGSWHIVREIGEGSFGKVFEIEREDFGYTYKAALKAITIPQNKAEIETVLDDGMNEESATAYFRGFVSELVDEIRLMSRLKGESNVVSYEDHYVAEHKAGIGWDVLIRMELLTPLIKHTRAHVLDRNAVINLGIDVCKALELCRRHNIIHRDIKPENIFVSENGQFKLGDFGIAKTVEKTTGGLSKKGTYTYMAPEVYQGEDYGPSVDLYSLGLVLYRYLNNNRTPFLPEYPKPITYTDKTEAINRRIKGEEIPTPANADEELAKIILKACAYNPKERYASPTEMRIALESLSEKPAVSVEKNTKDIFTADTVRDIQIETEKTVSVFGTTKGNKVAENRLNAKEKNTIENPSENEKLCDAEIHIGKTAAGVSTAGAKTEAGTEKTYATEKKITEESKRSGIKENKQSDFNKSQKVRKNITAAIVGVIAVALVIVVIVFLTKNGATDDNPINTESYTADETVSPTVEPTYATDEPIYGPNEAIENYRNLQNWCVAQNGITVNNDQICYYVDDGLILEGHGDGDYTTMIELYSFSENGDLKHVTNYTICDDQNEAENLYNDLNLYDRSYAGGHDQNCYGLHKGDADYYVDGNVVIEVYSQKYMEENNPRTYEELIALYQSLGWEVYYPDN